MKPTTERSALRLLPILTTAALACGGPTSPLPSPAMNPPPSGSQPITDGKLVSSLRFAIVGDSRPTSNGDTPGYPTQIITQIWQDVQSEAPDFAIGTGDYMFANYAADVNAQLDLYLGARAAFTGPFYPVMGNHECTGGVSSNCGPGSRNGMTANYQGFLDRMLGPIAQPLPYYALHFAAMDGSWTAKFVFLAANAWNDDQATWLEGELSKGSTYTFVVRHEGANATTALGVNPSANIMARHPYTLLLAGHSHTFAYYESNREVITGNGGAPLTGSVPYGYTMVERRNDGTIAISAKNYMTKQQFQSFAVSADGTAVR